MRTLRRVLAAMLASSGLLTATACGGGASAPTPAPGPPPPQAGLSGQILQDTGARVVSAANAGLEGATISALKASDGYVQASQTVAADGRFSFKSLPSGDFLVRINFTGDADLDNDGSPDSIEVIMPATVQGNSSTMVIVFASADTDNDGKPDSLLVRSDLTGSLGLRDQKLQRLNFKHHELLCDENGDADLDDDVPEADSDLDGIPDVPGHINALHGGVLHGEISAIDAGSLTVDGVSFEITNATVFRIRGNHDAAQADFSVGQAVLVRGLWNGEKWLALEVKLAGQGHGNGNGGGGADEDAAASFGGAITAVSANSLSVGDNEFQFSSSTSWIVRGEATGDLSLFDIGDIVMVKARLMGGAWAAESVRLILNLVKDDGPGDGGGTVTASFNGSIEAMGDGSVRVGGHELRFDSSTEWEAAGALTTDLSLFDVGDEVMVDAVFANEVWTATKVTLLVNNISDEPPGPQTQTFSANIDAISDASISVGGQAIGLTMTTTWMAEGTLTTDISLFDAGDGVEVDAISVDGQVWTALQVRLVANNVSDEPPPPQQQTFTGSITAITAAGLYLGDSYFVLDGDTQWSLIGGIPGAPELFGLTDEVEVLAEQKGSDWLALRVTMLVDHMPGII